jgi:hypothetical protein
MCSSRYHLGPQMSSTFSPTSQYPRLSWRYGVRRRCEPVGQDLGRASLTAAVGVRALPGLKPWWCGTVWNAHRWSCIHSEVYALIRLGRQGLRFQIPLNDENGRVFRAKRQDPLPIFDDHAFSLRKVQGPVGSSAIADQEREPRVAGAALPFAIRPMEAWGPCVVERPRVTTAPGFVPPLRLGQG